MAKHWPVVYAGNDKSCYRWLKSQLPSFTWESMEVEALTPENILREWRRVLVLDVDVACRDGFHSFREIRAVHGGIPIILLADLEGLRLVRMSLACVNGAEALFFKPLEDIQRLEESLRRGMQRIGHWHEMIRLSGKSRANVKRSAARLAAKAAS